MGINWTLEDIDNAGFNTKDVEITEDVGLYQQRQFAKNKDVELSEIHSFRLAPKKWITCYKKEPKRGYVELPILNF